VLTEYEDENDKSKGYNVVDGKKKIKLGSLAILKGGRGKSAKKPSDLRGEQTCTSDINQSLLNELGWTILLV
jgi:hypothetical protein